MQCISLQDDETPCPLEAVARVYGLPGYLWSGLHCHFHLEIVKRQYDHQGGCRVTDLITSVTRTYMANPKAVGAPENAPWGYLRCGCSNDGFGGHTR